MISIALGNEILEGYFPDFVIFFFPNIYPYIDWDRGYEFLDTELQKVVRDAELGKRYADRLVKVWKIDWVIRLPEDLELNFRKDLEDFEQERTMPYITSIERMAKQEGRQEGRQEGQQEGLISGIELALKLKFGENIESLFSEIAAIESVETLKLIQTRILNAETREDLQQIYQG